MKLNIRTEGQLENLNMVAEEMKLEVSSFYLLYQPPALI